MSKQLLREWYELCEGGVCQDLLTESEKVFVKNGGLILTGVVQRCDTQNGNGRIYGRDILDREVKNYKKIVEDRRALGELDHPEDSVVNLKNVSHMVTDIWWNGDNVMGKVKVLDTPSGKILRSLVESGVKLGISSRGLGSTSKKNGKTIVEDDFQLICFDFVQEPSTPGAFMMSEGKNRTLDPNKIWTKADRLNRLLNDIVKG
jgi:Prohead core protein serine protease